MKALRPFIWAAAMVAAFLYVTSVAHWDVGRALRPSIGRLWSEPASAATVGSFTADEQNNIDVYRNARDATEHESQCDGKEGAHGHAPKEVMGLLCAGRLNGVNSLTLRRDLHFVLFRAPNQDWNTNPH